MTTISSITSGRVYISPGRNERVDPLTRVADALDLSSGTLKDQLELGRSLNEIAADRGVPHGQLISAIRAWLPVAAGDAGATAERIAAQRSLPDPKAPRGENAGLRDAEKLEQLGELLGMKSEQVTARAGSPSDLVALFRDKGVSLHRMRDVLESGDLLDVMA
ncbi:hypothetical protein AB0F81_43870 [Actinoplanes sp. NPDC024001]|uniref:hypothetical protein n=1 Tax=Actinoplanes sp. NPDC024001 TaxID=3154598 RepID=UPI0033FF51EB